MGKKVCDINEDCGWTKISLLSNKRYAMIKENIHEYQNRVEIVRLL
ncbi:hypothetical protein [Wolbachia endosymbiont of Wuchereria bancrofti]|nr:hypothetical protein [Wolbachia endosymbiont of Wuchereria bancrofti]